MFDVISSRFKLAWKLVNSKIRKPILCCSPLFRLDVKWGLVFFVYKNITCFVIYFSFIWNFCLAYMSLWLNLCIKVILYVMLSFFFFLTWKINSRSPLLLIFWKGTHCYRVFGEWLMVPHVSFVQYPFFFFKHLTFVIFSWRKTPRIRLIVLLL